MKKLSAEELARIKREASSEKRDAFWLAGHVPLLLDTIDALEGELAEARAASMKTAELLVDIGKNVEALQAREKALRAVLRARGVLLCRWGLGPEECGRFGVKANHYGCDGAWCDRHAPSNAVDIRGADEIRALEALEREATKPKTATFPALPTSEDDEAIVDALKAKREGGRSR